MNNRIFSLLMVTGLLASGCNSNVAPGNDREAALDPAASPAEFASASAAIEGVETGLLQPEIMTDADLGSLPGGGGRCVFRFTQVGFPVFVYPAAGDAPATVKLNAKLVNLPANGSGRFAADGVEAAIRPLDESAATDAQFEAEFIVRFRGAPNELGFHGFSECGAVG